MESMNSVKTYQGLTLANVEQLIRIHCESFCRSAIDIGRDLVAARELVEHGAWSEWVKTNTGMSERTAERFMQVARNVPEGSALEGLSISKVEVLLQLPEGKREAAAVSAREEGKTVKQLKAEIEKMKESHSKAIGCYEQNMSARQDEINRLKAVNENLRSCVETYETEEKENPEIRSLQATIEELHRQLDAANARAEEQAAMRQEASFRATALEIGHGFEIDEDDADRLRSHVNEFLGDVDELKYNIVSFMQMDPERIGLMRVQVDRVIAWCDGMLVALNTAQKSAGIFEVSANG